MTTTFDTIEISVFSSNFAGWFWECIIKWVHLSILKFHVQFVYSSMLKRTNQQKDKGRYFHLFWQSNPFDHSYTFSGYTYVRLALQIMIYYIPYRQVVLLGCIEWLVWNWVESTIKIAHQEFNFPPSVWFMLKKTPQCWWKCWIFILLFCGLVNIHNYLPNFFE